jgi:uncharacterized protein
VHFEGSFMVPGRPDDILASFTDVERMARCMPGATLEPRAEDGSYPGAMVVAFGPKRIAFRGRVTHEIDATQKTGRLQGRGSADLRAARIAVSITYTLRPDAAATPAATIVSLVADAELGGVLADFARTGGTAVAKALMDDFSRRLAEEFSTPAAAAAPAPLAVHRLLRDIIKAKLRRFVQWLGLAGRNKRGRGCKDREKT